MSDVKKITIKKESSRYYWLQKHFDVVKINGIKKLVLLVSNQGLILGFIELFMEHNLKYKNKYSNNISCKILIRI